MAKAVGTYVRKKLKRYKRTSIGKSRWSRPKNKNKRGNWKRYRGQGR